MYDRSVEGDSSKTSFDWDAENAQHVARHRIVPSEFEEVFANDPIILNYEIVEGEERWKAIGRTNELRMLVIVFTIRDFKVRPVTGWNAGKRLIAQYFNRR